MILLLISPPAGIESARSQLIDGQGRTSIPFALRRFHGASSRAKLRKHGIRLKLHGQPFEILLILLDHQGEVVTREELQTRIWKGDTFVDFENGLNAAAKKNCGRRLVIPWSGPGISKRCRGLATASWR